MRRALLVVLLFGVCAVSARYEDGYRGGNKRSRFASESEEDDSDESVDVHQRRGVYDERRYHYESDESSESHENSDEPHRDKVTFSKRKLQHYVGDEDTFFDDVKASVYKQDTNRVPDDYHRDKYYPERMQAVPKQVTCYGSKTGKN